MKLGSLFDGSGGFPLAGAMYGIAPVWASEIEPFPIRVTTKRFPQMMHYGDVQELHGDSIEPVDVITFGSPCQDMSVAGKRAGIHEGKRSSLFFEAVRIITEMREATNGVHPRIAVWENVPGAFSSNQGEDFRCVLEALCRIADGNADVPRPSGAWKHAGLIVGHGYSIAWRQLDAQYWGVPQRRKRIYLVADFGSERAEEILFERYGLRGDYQESGEAREGAAGDAQGGLGGSGGAGRVAENEKTNLMLYDKQAIGKYGCNGKASALTAMSFKSVDDIVVQAFHCQQDPISSDRVSPCIGGQGQATVGICAAFMGGQGAKAGGIAYSEDVAPTLKAAPSGGNTVPDVCYPICIDCRNHRAQSISGTLQAKSNGGQSLNYTNPVCYPNVSGTLCASGAGLDRPAGQGNETDMVVCIENGQTIILRSKPMRRRPRRIYPLKKKLKRRFIVRRLTPLECCRLQGFPDDWCAGLAEDEPTEGEIDFFKGVWDVWRRMNGKKQASESEVVKWLKNPLTDGAMYKMWGNGIALPCAAFVLAGVARELCAENGGWDDGQTD